MLAITGSTGFIGSHILPYLSGPYRALVRRPEQVLSKKTHLLGDMENAHDIEALVKGTDTLVHLACTTNPRTSNRDIPADIAQNLISSARLFESFYTANPGGHILFVSTGGAMYDLYAHRKPIREDAPAAPWSSYGIHKLAAEHYLEMLARQHKGRATILRIGNPYGVLLPSQRGQGLIGVAMAHLKEKKTLSLLDAPGTVRDYVHLHDVAQAFLLALKKPGAKSELQRFHVGSGEGHSIKDVLKAIEKASGLRLKTEIVPVAKKMQASYNVLDCGRIKNELGWQPTITFEEGIARLWRSY